MWKIIGITGVIFNSSKNGVIFFHTFLLLFSKTNTCSYIHRYDLYNNVCKTPKPKSVSKQCASNLKTDQFYVKSMHLTAKWTSLYRVSGDRGESCLQIWPPLFPEHAVSITSSVLFLCWLSIFCSFLTTNYRFVLLGHLINNLRGCLIN